MPSPYRCPRCRGPLPHGHEPAAPCRGCREALHRRARCARAAAPSDSFAAPRTGPPFLAAACVLGLLLLSGAVALALPREGTAAKGAPQTVVALVHSPAPGPAVAVPAARHSRTLGFSAWLPPPAAPATNTLALDAPGQRWSAPPKVAAPRAVRQLPAETIRPKPVPPVTLFVNRRVARTEGELRKHALKAPTVTLDRTRARAESSAAVKAARVARAAGREDGDPTLALIDRRADLAGLPLRRGAACRLTKESAEHLAICAKSLREDAHDAGRVRKKLTRKGPWFDTWRHPDTVPALMQVLMAEAAPVREALAEQLARIDDKEATEALAQLGLFDLSPAVREEALGALAARPARDYQAALLRGFGHPWPPVADHAAEALVALKRADAVPALERLLRAPDPRAPYRKPGRREVYVRELVRVNHHLNCLLCHPLSFDSGDKARGEVPSPDDPLEPGEGEGAGLYGSGLLSLALGTFVRADITYLKQDFSVTLPVANPGLWPAEQRFDFFVRERLATERDVLKALARARAGPSEQHKAVRWALRELTGREPKPTARR